MRVATGVLLIIAALLNLIASFGYIAGGAATSGLSEFSETVMTAEVNGAEVTEEQREQAAKLSEEIDGSGIGLQAFGLFLLISVGVLIAGAVFLFTNKKPAFILVTGVVALLAEVIGILIISFGIMNIIGLVAGILALITGKAMMSEAKAPAPVES